MAAKHIATYPIYGTNPFTGRAMVNNRIGTGYIYSVDEISKKRAHLEQYGHPLRLRWRNDECWADALEQMKAAEHPDSDITLFA